MSFSFNCLGNLGHLGNQMFQYAFLFSMGKKHNRNIMIPPKSVLGTRFYTEIRSNIYDAFDIKCEKKSSKFSTFTAPFFHFNSDIYNNPPAHDLNFVGYFQSYHYLEEFADDIRKEFTFRKEFNDAAKEYRDEIKDEAISLHIRRTDYVNNPVHDTIGMDYYEKALAEMPDKPVIIFTDDVEWAKNHQMFSSDRFYISESDNPYIDMALMTMCDYHIIANSTFSWWGAWLADSKQVIAPSKWFGSCRTHDVSGFYCKLWRVI